MRAVLKKASWGTRRIIGSIRCKKQASTVRKRYSVPETPSYGTRCIFKGQQNSRLHKLWTASCRTGRIFSARNGPRSLCSLRRPLPLLLRRHSVPETTHSDVSRHKKKEGDLSVYQDFLELPAAPVLLPPHAYIAASAPSSKKIKKEDVSLGKVLEYTPFLAVSSNLPTYVSVGIYHSRIFLKS